MPPAARPAAAGQQLAAQQPLVVLLVQVIQPDAGEPLEHLRVAVGHPVTPPRFTPLNHLNKLPIFALDYGNRGRPSRASQRGAAPQSAPEASAGEKDMPDDRYFEPEIEAMPRQALAALQQE